MKQVNSGKVTVIAEDFRVAQLEANSFDVILAAAVLHQLLQVVGFRHLELFHKNTCFAAFGAIK